MSRRRKNLIAAIIIFGVAILIPIIHHYQLRFAVEKYISELKAKGEPMELAQVIPPPVPPEQNGVPFIKDALGKLGWNGLIGTNPPQAMRAILPGRAIIGWQQPNLIGWPVYNGFAGTNTWTDLGRDLVAAKSELESFQNLTNHPVLDFNLDYQKGSGVLLPHLGWLKQSAQWVNASALYNLHQGNPKSACADVRAMIALVKGETDERIAISQLVRIAIAAIGANATWEILQDPNVSDDDLAELQQDWQSLEFTRPLGKSFKFERFSALQQFKHTRTTSEEFNKLWGFCYAPDAPKPDISQFGVPIQRSLFLRRCDEFRWRWFWSYEDELYELQSFEIMMRVTQMVETKKTFLSAQSFASSNLAAVQIPAYARHKPPILIRVGGVGAYGSAMLRKVATIETSRNVVIAAIALKRYELRHQQLPTTLEKLTPEFLSSVLIDCMDGQPLRYRRNADGTFSLYSVGANGVDDGGDPSLEKYVTSSNHYWQNDHALDWVWPQPATDAEKIHFFYDHPPK